MGEDMLKFYDVDEPYVKYLKQHDNKVPDVTYATNSKFVCGIVLDVNGINYYAPISHFNQKQRTNFPIIDKGNIIATIRFCFMIPAPAAVLTEKNFRTISVVDHKYADLLKTEYVYCKAHSQEIMDKALAVYKIGCNPNHAYFNTCCDFRKLESAYLTYIAK